MTIINWMKNNEKFIFMRLLLTCCSISMSGMDNLSQINSTDSWFIYGQDSTEGTKVSGEVLALSNTIQDLLADLGDVEEKTISLPFPQSIIRIVVNLLTQSLQNNGLQRIEMSIEGYALSSLVLIANCFDYLACPVDIQNIILSHIKQMINSNNVINDNDLVTLNPDLQKLIMVDYSIDYLKDLIIDKEMSARKKILPSLSGVNCLAFGPDNKEIISGSGQGVRTSNSLIWWNGLTGDKIKALPIFQRIQSIAISPDGTKILVGCNEDDDTDQDSLTMWDRVTAKLIRVFSIKQSIRAVAWSPDGTKVLSSSPYGDQNGLIIWDAQTGDRLMNLPVDMPVLSVAWSPDGTKIASGCEARGKNLIIWDIQDNKAIKQQYFLGDSAAVIAVAWNHDGTKLVSGGAEDEKRLKIWNSFPNDFVETESIVAHSNPIFALAWSPDGKRIVSGSRGDQNLILWTLNDNGTITKKDLDGVEGNVNSIAFNNIGTLMAVGSDYIEHLFGDLRIFWNDSLIVWTLLTEQEYAVLNEIHNYNVAHIRLIYQFCLTHAEGLPITLTKESSELSLFATLPKNIKTLLKRYILTH